jgi:hypothetical protein
MLGLNKLFHHLILQVHPELLLVFQMNHLHHLKKNKLYHTLQ